MAIEELIAALKGAGDVQAGLDTIGKSSARTISSIEGAASAASALTSTVSAAATVARELGDLDLGIVSKETIESVDTVLGAVSTIQLVVESLRGATQIFRVIQGGGALASAAFGAVAFGGPILLALKQVEAFETRFERVGFDIEGIRGDVIVIKKRLDKLEGLDVVRERIRRQTSARFFERYFLGTQGSVTGNPGVNASAAARGADEQGNDPVMDSLADALRVLETAGNDRLNETGSAD